MANRDHDFRRLDGEIRALGFNYLGSSFMRDTQTETHFSLYSHGTDVDCAMVVSMVSKVKEGRSTIVQVVDVQGTESSVAAQAQTKMLPMKMMGTVVVIVIQIIFRISLTVTMI
jgi:hypothetical protein